MIMRNEDYATVIEKDCTIREGIRWISVTRFVLKMGDAEMGMYEVEEQAILDAALLNNPEIE